MELSSQEEQWPDQEHRHPASLHPLGTREFVFSSEAEKEWALAMLGNARER